MAPEHNLQRWSSREQLTLCLGPLSRDHALLSRLIRKSEQGDGMASTQLKRPSLLVWRRCAHTLVAGLIGTAASCSTHAEYEVEPPLGLSDVITRSQLEDTHARNVYEAIERARPTWLVSRGVISAQNPAGELPVVYLNGVRAGGLELLRSLNPHEVESIRFHSAHDAMTRWGMGLHGGVIEVTMRK